MECYATLSKYFSTEKQLKIAFPNLMVESWMWGLGIRSAFQPEGGQEGSGAGPQFRARRFHGVRNTLRFGIARQLTRLKLFSLLVRCTASSAFEMETFSDFYAFFFFFTGGLLLGPRI